MLERKLIATAQVPDGEELQLISHGRDFMIVFQRNELMSTRMQHCSRVLLQACLVREASGRVARLAPCSWAIRRKAHRGSNPATKGLLHRLSSCRELRASMARLLVAVAAALLSACAAAAAQAQPQASSTKQTSQQGGQKA